MTTMGAAVVDKSINSVQNSATHIQIHLASTASWLKPLPQFRALAAASDVASLPNGNTHVPSAMGNRPVLAKQS